ncbi:hypothetical protein HQ535_03245 [bacterium]|nr:hypothetical protein [bacterium]
MQRSASALIIALTLAAAACGDGTMTVAEYADGAEELVHEMEQRFASLDSVWQAGPPSVEGAERYWEGRMEIRDDFLEGIRDLEPPRTVARLHETSLDLFARITAADEALAARVATFETITDHWEWVATPEGRASDALLQEIYAFCRATQEDFDATAGAGALENVPWVPADVETVKVAFGCPPSGQD